MTDPTPDLTFPGSTVAELRVRVEVLNKVLTELVGRTVPADSELAGFLRVALDQGRAIGDNPATGSDGETA
jgi:hypothetical protein